VQLEVEDASRRLRMGDLGIPANPAERFTSTSRASESHRSIAFHRAEAIIASHSFCREIEGNGHIIFTHLTVACGHFPILTPVTAV